MRKEYCPGSLNSQSMVNAGLDNLRTALLFRSLLNKLWSFQLRADLSTQAEYYLVLGHQKYILSCANLAGGQSIKVQSRLLFLT